MMSIEKCRVLMLEQVTVVLTTWRTDEVESNYSDVVEIVRRGLLDPALQVRSTSRDVLCLVADLWCVVLFVVFATGDCH